MPEPIKDSARHPTPDKLVDFALGRLDYDERETIEKHVANCDTCCEQLGNVPGDSVVAMLRQAGTPEPIEEGVAPDIPFELREHARYAVVRVIGQGGMGVVYEARHRVMQRRVALKVVRQDLVHDVMAVARFEKEVRAAAQLTHPNIVTAFDAETAGNTHFLVMEYLEGEDVGAHVHRRGALPVSQACEYVRQAALGLQYAHEHQTVHRDIKPQNLFLTTAGVIKILDFGIARFAVESGTNDETLTAMNAVMGSPDYMAPEQAIDPRDADIRADLFSLGTTLFFLLTRQPAFEPTSFRSMVHLGKLRHMRSVLDFRSNVPAQVVNILQRLTEPDPDARYQTPTELVADIEASCVGEDSPAGVVPGAVTRDAAEGLTLPLVRMSTNNSTVAAKRSLSARSLGWSVAIAALVIVAIVVGIIFYPPAKEPKTENAALRFDGRSAYVAVSSLKLRMTPITIEAHVTPEHWNDAQISSTLVAWHGGDSVAVYYAKGRWGCACRMGDREIVRNTRDVFVSGSATHIAAIWDGNDVALYINGKSHPMVDVVFSLGPLDGGLFIGGIPLERLPSSQQDGRFFSGVIDDVRISQGVRYPTPFFPPQRLKKDAATLALYQFDEGQGETAHDSSGNGHTGTIVQPRWELSPR